MFSSGCATDSRLILADSNSCLVQLLWYPFFSTYISKQLESNLTHMYELPGVLQVVFTTYSVAQV